MSALLFLVLFKDALTISSVSTAQIEAVEREQK